MESKDATVSVPCVGASIVYGSQEEAEKAFTKKEIMADRAYYQRVIDAIDNISRAARSIAFDDDSLVQKYQSLLCKGPTLQICQKVSNLYGGTSNSACEKAACPIYPKCYDYVDTLWRCVRALLTLAGAEGGYKDEESMRNRCRLCDCYIVCRNADARRRARYCIGLLKEKATEAQAFIDEKLK